MVGVACFGGGLLSLSTFYLDLVQQGAPHLSPSCCTKCYSSLVESYIVPIIIIALIFNRNITTAEQQTVIGTLAVDGWAVTFGTARRGPAQSSPRCNVTAHIIRCGTIIVAGL